MEGDWAIHSQSLIIDCNRLYSFVRMKKLEPLEIPIDMIAHKEIDSISVDSIRYIRANTSLPGIVAESMENPFMKKYRMIDGRHRLLKTLNSGKRKFNAYVLCREDILKFVRLL